MEFTSTGVNFALTRCKAPCQVLQVHRESGELPFNGPLPPVSSPTLVLSPLVCDSVIS